LTALTNNPVAVKAAASKFIELSIKESDNNVKLIVLDKVDQLRQKNEGVLDDLTMEILRVLSSPDLDVRRKALGLAMEMVSSKNVEEVILLLKKELGKTMDEQYEKVRVGTNVSLKCMLTVCAEQRIQVVTCALHPSMRHQVLRSCRKCCGTTYGFHLRLQQCFCCRCDQFCERSG
jgi:vesicle coat complex subunit